MIPARVVAGRSTSIATDGDGVSPLFATSHLVGLDGFCQVTGWEVAEWRGWLPQNFPIFLHYPEYTT